MIGNVICKTLKTRGGYYVYDRHANVLCKVAPEEFAQLQEVERGELDPEKSGVIAKYRASSGMFAPNAVTGMRHPSTDILEHLANYRMGQLTLQVTQQCNLRCGYCCYGGNYDNMRQHSGKRMPWETAKKAIDFFLAHSLETPEPHISFYGGEPMLEFDLIKRCVSYVKEQVEGKKITYGMTTNGTLLTEEAQKYLVENDFQLSISLDGSKEEHDANRKFPSGKGSFDLIMGHVAEMRERYPDYMKKLNFMTTINPKADLGCVLEHFTTSEILSDSNLIFSFVVTVGIKDELDYNEKFDLIRTYEYLKLMLMLTGKIKEKSVSPLVISSKAQRDQFYQGLKNHTPMQGLWHHGGPCIPGVKRLFVTTDGVFFPCEKVNENSRYFCIGSLEKGLNMERMTDILNSGKVTEEDCISCWNLRNCSICANQVEFDDSCTLCRENKRKVCAKEKRRVLEDFYETCVLREFGYVDEQ